MPSTLTPPRRRRRVESHDEDEDEGERASKRARSESVGPGMEDDEEDREDAEDGGEEEEEEEGEEGDRTVTSVNGRASGGSRRPRPDARPNRERAALHGKRTNGERASPQNGAPNSSLPDAFRPPPGDATSQAPRGHQPGAIVRVKLANFVTYKAVEFFPGPSLNMVIGPNGTGKSTLVCAICIGLGWDPKYLGRQKEVSEFVKHGESEGSIEIELQRRKGQNRNPIIKCQVKRDANKTVYALNGRPCSKKQIQELARKYAIQIDNLCQFLPQDKVVEFAAMSPVDLLYSTEQAVASSQVITWHKRLSAWRVDQKKVETEMTSGAETLKNLETRQKAQEADVARVREREEVQMRLQQWKNARPYIRVQETHKKQKEHERGLKEAKDDLTRAEDELEPALRAVNAKAAYRDAIQTAKTARANAVDAADKDCVDKAAVLERMQSQFGQLDNQIERARKDIKDDKVELARLTEGVKNIESQLKSEPPNVDLTAINEQIRAKERRQIEIREDDFAAARRELEKLKADGGAIQQKIGARKKDIEGLDSRTGKQENKLQRSNQETYQAWKWVREHQDQFQKPIFGPPMVECSVKDPRIVPQIEALFQRNDFMYLVVQTRADFKKLHEIVKERLRLPQVNIRTAESGLERFRPPQVATHDMQRWGFEGWALDYMEGPEPVLAALCETCNLHRTAVALQDTSQAQFDDILAKGSLQAWVTNKSFYRVQRRREYGPDAQSTTVRDVRPPQVWTETPVDPEAKREMEHEIEVWNDEFEAIKEKAREPQAQIKALQEEGKSLQVEVDELKREKDENQKLQSAFRILPTRLANQKEKIKAREVTQAERREHGMALGRESDDLMIARADAVVAYTETIDALLIAHQLLHEAELMFIEANSDHATLVGRNQNVQDVLNEKRTAVQTLKQEGQSLGTELERAKKELAALDLTTDDHAFLREHRKTPLADLDATIASEEARLELMHGSGGSRTLQEYEERGRRIETLRRRQGEFDAALADLNHNITQVRGKWEPLLDNLVRRISDAFAFNMRQINCAGEVAIHKDADFDQWAIQIRVKFREHEPLTQLDAHRQSGGERAVSTVFYLMSLQALTRSPFRVVDEINQGMDPRNERLVHGRMVAIATGKDEWETYYREHLAGSETWARGTDGGDLTPDAERTAAGPIDNDDDGAAHDPALDLEAADGDPPDEAADANAAPGGPGGSQYFLITPKLLHGLRYEEGMTVLCIASGEHMAGAAAVDFGRALEVRRAGFVAAR